MTGTTRDFGMHIHDALRVEGIGVVRLTERQTQVFRGVENEPIVALAAIGKIDVPATVLGREMAAEVEAQTAWLFRLSALATVKVGIDQLVARLSPEDWKLWDAARADAEQFAEENELPEFAGDIDQAVDDAEQLANEGPHGPGCRCTPAGA